MFIWRPRRWRRRPSGWRAALLAVDDVDGALAVYDQLLGERPDLAQAHANRAEALNRIGRYAEAFEAIEAAHRITPDDPRVALNRAFALLAAGRLDEGFAAYEARLAPALPSAPLRRNLVIPRWTGGPPPGLLLVAAEQGLGDELRFAASVARLLALGTGVIVEVEPRLVGLFRRSLPGAAVVPYDRRRSGVRPIFDYGWLADAGPRPGRLDRRRQPAAPARSCRAPSRSRRAGYLTPDPDRVAAVRDRLRAGAPAVHPGRHRLGQFPARAAIEAATTRRSTPGHRSWACRAFASSTFSTPSPEPTGRPSGTASASR